MAAITHLERAPITEALLDFRVTLPGEFRVDAFLPVREALRAGYPVVDEQRGFKTTFQFKPGNPPVTGTELMGPQGYFFKSQDGLNIAQFRVNGFTYNRLAPYTSWDQVLPEALRLWDIYVEVAKPLSLDRLAVRYINRMKFPAGVDTSRYLNVLPPLFPGAPRVVSGFVTRISTSDPASGLSTNVTEALDPALEPPFGVVILDIDAFVMAGLAISQEHVRQVLERLRTVKNDVFFGSITDETVRMYK